MNASQSLYYQQVKSDWQVFELLQSHNQDAHPCHRLHYLQMLTEKLGKAYEYGRATPPDKASHKSFAKFVRGLAGNFKIGRALGFSRASEFQKYLQDVNVLAIEIERLAPSLAQGGPNPEYPWPKPPAAPIEVPANFDFPLWRVLTQRARGKKFLSFVERLIAIFPEWF